MTAPSNDSTAVAALQQELTQLRERLSMLEAREARRRRWVLGLVAATFVMAPLALAANGNCPNGLPNCFVPNNPALASEVNHNFAQLKEWLELKVGTVAGNVAITTPTTISSTLDVPGASAGAGNINASGTVTARNLSVSTAATLNGTLNTVGNATFSSALVNGDFRAPNNQHEGCYDTGYECGWLQCANGYYMVGLDIAENENCGGGGDYDFSPFALRCCKL